jgi:hypothetical protein
MLQLIFLLIGIHTCRGLEVVVEAQDIPGWLRVEKRDCRIQVTFGELKEPLLSALSSCMTFLDLTEGDKLALLVVELHVGRGDSMMRSGIEIRYLLCLLFPRALG